MINKTTLLLTAITIIFCIYPWQELATAGGLGFIRNNVGWVIFIALILFFSWPVLGRKRYSLPQFWLVGLVGCFIACIPFAFNTFQFVPNSLWLPLGLLIAWVFLLTLLNSPSFLKNKNVLLLLIIIIGSLQVLTAFWQLFHSYMMEATGDIIEHQLPEVKGTFNQRNLYASFIATGLICALCIFPIKKELVIDNKLLDPAKQNSFLSFFIFAASFTLFLTDSRVGIYSFIAGLTLLFISYRSLWKEKLVKPTALIIIGVILSQIVINVIYDNKTKDFSETGNRELIYFTSLEAIKDKPVLGHGLGSFEKVYLEKLGELISKEKIRHEEVEGRQQNITHPHNELLYWGVQGGLVSILGLLLTVLSVLSLFRHNNLTKSLAYIALLLPISLHLMVELPFYISILHLMVYVLLVAYVIASLGGSKSHHFSIKHVVIPKVVSGLLACALMAALLVNSYSLSKAVKFEKALNPDLRDLDKVILTLGWEDTYQSLKLRHEANMAVKLGMLEPLIEYLQWLEQQIEISPRLNYYFNLYAVNRYLGNSVKAQFYYNEIKRLFVGVREAENWLEMHKNTKD